MTDNKPAHQLPVELVDPKYFYENDVTEEVIEALLKNFPEYYAALDQSGVALDDLILLSRHPNYDEEDYCLYRYFAAEGSPKGFILVLVSDEHLKQAIVLAEAKEMTKDLPAPPKKKKKGDEVL